jgi:hypothetical protein
LVEAHYFQNRQKPTPQQIKFWLTQLRTPELLHSLATCHASVCRRLMPMRPALVPALTGNMSGLEQALMDEERFERERDKSYWLPLRRELEILRHGLRLR